MVPLYFAADASDFVLGYILAQEENKALLPIHYIGCVSLPSEIRYAPTEKELLAIFYAVKREEVNVKSMNSLCTLIMNHLRIYKPPKVSSIK